MHTGRQMAIDTTAAAAPARGHVAWAGRVGLALSLALALAACGGGGSDAPSAPALPAAPATALITGVAATGAAMAGANVTVTNAAGNSAGAVTGSDGRFAVVVLDAAPFVLKATDATGKVWYSFAASAGAAHITPLTTLALLTANQNKPLATLAEQWMNPAARPSADQVLAAAKTVNANLSTLMAGAGLSPTTANIFTAPDFAANHTGLDAVLDQLRVAIDCGFALCTQRITTPTGSALVSWNPALPTSGVNLSWQGVGSGMGAGTLSFGLGSCKAPVPGTYSVVVHTTVTGSTAIVPEICTDGVDAMPATEAEFCATPSGALSGLPAGAKVLSCSFKGNVGTLGLRLSAPLVVDFHMSFTFVKR